MRKIFYLFLLLSSTTFAQKLVNIEVKENKVACEGVVKGECLQVKEGKSKKWTVFHGSIEGFDYVPGYKYKLKVEKSKIKGKVPADASSYKYKLKKVVKKEKVFDVSLVNGFLDKKMILTEIDGKRITDGNVYFVLDSQNGSMYGKSGVNRFNAMYTINKKEITLKPGMSTLMAADEALMKLEQDFVSKLDKTFIVEQKDNKVFFKDAKGKTVMEFVIPTEKDVWSFIDGKEWKLFMLDNVGMDYGNASISFNLAEKKVYGNSGCNRFFGSFEYSKDLISFSQLGSTKMACLDEESNKTESKVLGYLSSGELRYDVAEQTLNFYKGDRLVMVFGLVK